jgi:DNA adenine methylase
MNNCNPFIKWVGGKRRVIPEIEKRLPQKFNRYFEPFIGGGALLFHLNRKDSFISDMNGELINLYRTVRDNLEELMQNLELHENSSDYFYNIRDLDRDHKTYSQLPNIEKASRFIYLNKSCFNGLYRVNRKGQFNVPFGKYKNPIYFERENLTNCSKFLKGVEIREGDFETYKDKIQKEDFVYFDPPYFPITETANFTSYTKDGFGFKEQKRLLDFAKEIDSRGGYFLLSNSYSDEVLGFYKDFHVDIVEVGRTISSKATARGKQKEILVKNY